MNVCLLFYARFGELAARQSRCCLGGAYGGAVRALQAGYTYYRHGALIHASTVAILHATHRVHACTMAIVPACTMVIVHGCTVALVSTRMYTAIVHAYMMARLLYAFL